MSKQGVKKFGMVVRKRDDEISNVKQSVATVFNMDSDEEEEDASAADKFKKKYAVPEKMKDKLMLQKAKVEDPSVFEYDEHYEQIQRDRDQKVIEQKEADKEKKPKYMHLMLQANKKREMEKLLHDEHTYKKEREMEAGEFDDKEVYVTGAYRKQIEERNKFRDELEQQDKLDEMMNVKDQKLWQQAFQRKMLDDRSRVYSDQREQTAAADMDQNAVNPKEEMETDQNMAKPNEEIETDQNMAKPKEEKETPPPETISNELNGESRERPTGSDNRRPAPARSRASHAHSPPTAKHDELTEEVRRMEIIRKVLQRRNDEESLKRARERYLKRVEMGEVQPPFC